MLGNRFKLTCLIVLLTAQYVSADDEGMTTAFLDNRYQETADLARALWDYAEVGYQETRSSALMQKTLADEGFSITAGVAGIPTAFVAEYGNSGPVIGILAEFDALPGINQDAVETRSPIEGKGAGHACGHNLFGAGSVSAAIAVRHWLQETGNEGRVRVYGTPAEEGGSGKVYMVRAGLFEDVDIVLHWHAADRNSAIAASSLANRSAKFRFKGQSAHASAAPWNARSALDGVEAMNAMVNQMREHVPQETRIHYVITAGGFAPNVVPDYAEVFYYLRHPSATTLLDLWPRLEAAAEGAAMGTGTEVEWEIIHGNHAVQVNETLARVMDKNLRQVGGLNYTPAEQSFAESIYASLVNPLRSLGSESEIQDFEVQPVGRGGSTDVADVSMVVPTAGLRVATWVPGTSAHSWQSTAASGMSIGFKGAHIAAKTLALTAIDIMKDADLRKAALEEFHERRGEDFTYIPILGDRDPPLDYRK